jgi:transposase
MTAALVEAGVMRDAGVVLADELRLGLRGQVRRVLAPRGVGVTPAPPAQVRVGLPPTSRRPAGRHAPLALAGAATRWADPRGRRRLGARCRHPGRRRRPSCPAPGRPPTIRIRLPAYSPELNPAERVFQEVRRRTEGRVYDSVADKQAIADAYLAELAADPDRIRRLCGWAWVRSALDQRPDTASA